MHPHPRPRRRPVRTRRRGPSIARAAGFAPVCLSLLLCGCGLEVYDNLFAISPDHILFSTSFVTFKHNLSNAGTAFLGYDLYYRLFDSSEAALISPMRQEIENLYLSSSGQLSSDKYKFRKLVSSTQGESPYIDLRSPLASEAITMNLDFGFIFSAGDPLDFPFIKAFKDSDPGTAIVNKQLQRYIVPDLKTFRENDFEFGDADLPAVLAAPTAGKTVIMCICVVAYGYDSSRNQNLISQAVFLTNPNYVDGGYGAFKITFTN